MGVFHIGVWFYSYNFFFSNLSLSEDEIYSFTKEIISILANMCYLSVLACVEVCIFDTFIVPHIFSPTRFCWIFYKNGSLNSSNNHGSYDFFD